jgi:hypothetical protein
VRLAANYAVLELGSSRSKQSFPALVSLHKMLAALLFECVASMKRDWPVPVEIWHNLVSCLLDHPFYEVQVETLRYLIESKSDHWIGQSTEIHAKLANNVNFGKINKQVFYLSVAAILTHFHEMPVPKYSEHFRVSLSEFWDQLVRDVKQTQNTYFLKEGILLLGEVLKTVCIVSVPCAPCNNFLGDKKCKGR